MEAMAVESLVANVWELDGFLSKVRWPVRVHGGYSDIDVVGVRADGTVRLAQCKVPGPALSVNVITADFGSWLGEWAACLDNLERLWAERPPWLPELAQVREIEFWFCGNIWLPSEYRGKVEGDFAKLIDERCPIAFRGKVRGKVWPTRDLVLEAVKTVYRMVVDDYYGKRFGNPLLDSIRELVRYLRPQPHGAGRVGAHIAAETREELLRAFRLEATTPS